VGNESVERLQSAIESWAVEIMEDIERDEEDDLIENNGPCAWLSWIFTPG
jgi:hypothetical protein